MVLGIVRILHPISNKGDSGVEITAYNELYETHGAGRNEFFAWQSAHGVDSHGVGKRGETFLPAFPVFSKVAWMFVEPIDLSIDETSQLVEECGGAIAKAADPHAENQLEAIRRVAAEALAQSTSVGFEHP